MYQSRGMLKKLTKMATNGKRRKRKSMTKARKNRKSRISMKRSGY